MLSDEYVDRFDPHDDARSSSSSKNSRTSSPTGFSSNHPFVPRKTPPTGAHESNHQITNKRYPQPPAISSSISSNGQGSTVSSPRRSNASNHSMQESPTSKRSSLSTRTFRSNSQLSEISPMKGEHPQLVQQSTGSTAIKSGSSTPRHSFQGGYRPNSSYPVPLQVEEASSKLHDLKLKNVDRLKLDTKLGNIINNTSQENLVASPTASQYHGGSSAMDNNDNKSTSLDLSKRSKILSIPILSSRGRHNT
ncbi:hypothetical protein PMKS-004100 [Pichia membranifaciens]|uniref:Uncharacterized protein n=1 Tax=Pichia membranifaciens TaxID=4926 RepID=A0A1Q2YLZ7_9ASCO|nr:hypothetical protein PMKS-004100 [Pichia membranifaciens]